MGIDSSGGDRAGSRIAVIGAPSSAGAHGSGQERGPAALRAAGLLDLLRARGFEVADPGDLPEAVFHPDPERPREQNASLVIRVAHQVRDRVARATAERAWPLVVGGDCTITLGVIAGLLGDRPDLGLVYFDGDVDLNTKDTTLTGILDGMVLAQILGRGSDDLVGVGSRVPLLSQTDIVLFGYNEESGWMDPAEAEALARSTMLRYPVSALRQDAGDRAREALVHLEGRAGGFLVHFDVDVMDFAAADVPHPHALSLDASFDALRVFVSSPACVGLVVTEFNPDRDPDGGLAGDLVRRLVDAIGHRATARQP